MSRTKANRKTDRPQRNPNFVPPARSKEVLQLLASTLDPRNTSLESFRERYLSSCVWSKYSSSGLKQLTGKEDSTPKDRQHRAIAKWLAVESGNEKTNSRLIFRSCDFGFATSTQIINLMKRYITETLGLNPPPLLGGEFTGGASTRVKRGVGAISAKFEGKAHVSSSARPYWADAVFRSTLWVSLSPESLGGEVQENSVLFTVPKNSEIDRVACKEPEANMYLQRGAGLFIRNRLRRRGIDLNDQTRNQLLAKEGSITGKLSTVDLSSASDTVTRSLVGLVLPPAWFALLDDLRVKEVLLPDGTYHSLKMFSSMGNGFTFELESLIFWALIRSVATLIRCPGKIGVYGDDLVCHRKIALSLSRVLPWLGFKMNAKKTFFYGSFRESCGSHYDKGSDVTPFYVREYPSELQQIIRIGNQLLKWILMDTFPSVLHPRYIDLWFALSAYVPESVYGGQSFERSDALVTGHAPRKRLVQVHKPSDVCQVGSYLQWHHEKEKYPEMVTSPTEAAYQSRWVLRPNQSWYGEDSLFSAARWLINETRSRRID